ncbi:MAG: hypothetical protein IT439_06175 [Phycisphaerales bacterium]|nr:hypothetical protein [Phycisphaerales bacterium]
MKSRLVIVLGVAAVATTAFVLWRVLQPRDAGDPPWLVDLNQHVQAVRSRGTRFPQDVYDQRDRVWNEFLRKETWTREDVDWIISQAMLVPIDYTPPAIEPPNSEQINPNLADNAMSVIRTRLKYKGPIEGDGVDRLATLMLAWSHSASPFRRMEMTQALVSSGLVARPEIRARMEEMKNDPLPVVAANARRQLAGWDADRRAAETEGDD